MDFAILILFAIILAIITVVFYNLGRLQPNSKFGSKNALIWICILTGFIVSLLGIIIAVSITKHGEDELKLDKAIEETNSILVKARHYVDGISFDSLDWSFMNIPNKHLPLIGNRIVNNYRGKLEFRSTTFHDVLEDKVILISNFVEDSKEISKDINELNEALPAACGKKIYDIGDQLYDIAVNINAYIGPTMSVLEIMDNDMDTMENYCQKLVDEQKKLDFVKSMIKTRIETMNKMINKFQTDIIKSDETEQEWGRKMRELAPFWITENIVKLLVNVVCIMLIIMSIISIITLYRPSLFGQKIVPSKLISILFCITAILTIISGLIVLIVSIGTVGQFDCPLKNDTFGVANFTVPIPDSNGNREFSLCATSNSTVFSRIFPLINRDEIMKNLKIEEYEKKMLASFIQPVTHIDLPSSVSEDLETTRNFFKKLKELYDKNCLDDTAQPHLYFKMTNLERFLRGSDEFKSVIDGINRVVEKENSFKTSIKYIYKYTIEHFETAIYGITKNITAVDFPCESIVAGYSECAPSICKQFDSPLDTYSIYLLITILICLISLILFASIYNSLTIINEDIKSDPKSPVLTPTSPVFTPTRNVRQ